MLKINHLPIPLGMLLAIATYILLATGGQPHPVALTAAVTVLCACWWIFEPIPIPITSLLPLAVFPLFGVLSAKQVGAAYGSPLILLLLGGFMLSTALAKSGAHRRIAMTMIHWFGGNSARAIVFGFMAAAAVLSMWISNTATTLMLLPVALAVLDGAERRLATPLLLGIAYAASIGGLGTPIGTPPNLIFMQVYEEQLQQQVSFVEWMRWGIPTVVIFVPLAGLWLTRKVQLNRPIEIPHPGRFQQAEIRVLLVFAITALLWITRTTPSGGWKSWLSLPGANDASVALLAVIAMSLIPDGRKGRLLDWDTAKTIPWGVLLLFGGGITIASAFVQSGLADVLAKQLDFLVALPVWLMILMICLSVTFLTEVTSNTATASLLMPILASAAVATNTDPRLLMIPAALSASCAFMLPVATAPNAVIYGSRKIKTSTMAREGLALNLLGAVIISLICWVSFGIK